MMLDFDIGGGSSGWIEFKPSKAAWRMPNEDGDVADANWKYAIFHLDSLAHKDQNLLHLYLLLNFHLNYRIELSQDFGIKI
mgnify:CR=1 FL=1